MPRFCHIVRLAALAAWPILLAAGKPAAPAPLPGEVVRVGEVSQQAVPDAQALAKAEKTVREVYAKEYALRQPAERTALASRMLEEAGRTDDDPAARYVLLREARDIAASVPDVALLSQALRRMDGQFRIEEPGAALTALVSANHAAVAPQACASVARACLVTADRCVLADDCETAGKLCAVARSAADRSHEQPLIQRVAAKGKELVQLAAEYGKSKEAGDTLKQKPADPAASLVRGSYACLVRNDWKGGLPLLARAVDSPLCAVARIDLSAPEEPARQLDLANQFWELSLGEAGMKRGHMRQRAAFWYRRALPALAGLHRSSAEARLAAIETDAFRDRGIESGLAAELFRGEDFARRIRTRIDATIDFDWGLNAPDASLPKDGFAIRWTGFLHLPSPGRYEITVVANSGARIWVDGKPLIDNPNLTRSRNGVKALLDSETTLVPLRVDYWDTSGTARMRLLWRTPESPKEEPLPPSACWHETIN